MLKVQATENLQLRNLNEFYLLKNGYFMVPIQNKHNLIQLVDYIWYDELMMNQTELSSQLHRFLNEILNEVFSFTKMRQLVRSLKELNQKQIFFRNITKEIGIIINNDQNYLLEDSIRLDTEINLPSESVSSYKDPTNLQDLSFLQQQIISFQLIKPSNEKIKSKLTKQSYFTPNTFQQSILPLITNNESTLKQQSQQKSFQFDNSISLLQYKPIFKKSILNNTINKSIKEQILNDTKKCQNLFTNIMYSQKQVAQKNNKFKQKIKKTKIKLNLQQQLKQQK